MFLYADQAIKVQIPAAQLLSLLQSRVKRSHEEASVGELYGEVCHNSFSFQQRVSSNRGYLGVRLLAKYQMRGERLEVVWNTQLPLSMKICIFVLPPCIALLSLDEKVFIFWLALIPFFAVTYHSNRMKLVKALQAILTPNLKWAMDMHVEGESSEASRASLRAENAQRLRDKQRTEARAHASRPPAGRRRGVRIPRRR